MMCKLAKNKKNDSVIAVLLIGAFFLFIGFPGNAQQSVFQLLKDDLKKADAYYNEGSFSHALTIYLDEQRKSGNEKETKLKIARCYYHLHQYANSAKWFEKSVAESANLIPGDRFLFAETLAAINKYPQAIDNYKEYLKSNPDDELVANKVWRLKNIQFLFEDSLHYSVRKAAFNTAFAEVGAIPNEKGVVFLSNRKGATSFDKSDALTGENSYRIFFVPYVTDPLSNYKNGFGKVVPYDRSLDSKYHNGPMSFYDGGKKLVFTRTAEVPGQKGRRSLHLYFAQKESKGWKVISPFPFNNPDYSVTEPFITDDGLTLIFSSDMKGGFGGMDLYKSEFSNGSWSKPLNLGELINTRYDETFPHLNNGSLYFSSNGHPGFGGLDVFKIAFTGSNSGELLNLGYPVNSTLDDFSFTSNAQGETAYLTSNRDPSGSDDVYEVEIDLQTYPVVITGVLKTKAFTLTDSSSLMLLSDAKMFLIDHSRDIVVDEVVTSETGEFQLDIPYFSQYKIRVVEKNGTATIVSLHIPRQKRLDYNHEIVVVKDAFHTREE